MKKSTTTKRLLTIALSCIVAFSSLIPVLSVTAFAEPSDTAQWVYDGAASGLDDNSPISIQGTAITPKEGTNLLIGKKMDTLSYNAAGDGRTFYNANADLTADGIINNVDLFCGDYIDVIFNIEDSVIPDYFVLVNRADLVLQTYNYEVYTSDTLTGVKSSSSLVATYSRTDDATVNHEVNILQFPQNISAAKFLRIKLIRANYSHTPTSFRYSEMMLIGTKTADADPYAVYESDNKSIPTENALTAPTVEFLENGNTWQWGKYNVPYLQDGAPNGAGTGEFSAGCTFAKYITETSTVDWLTDGREYFDIKYTFDKVMDVSGTLVMNHENLFWRTGHYKIYASKTADTLFNDENCISEFTNGAYSRTQQFKYNSVVAKYVALRILDPFSTHETSNTTITASNNPSNPRLTEFKVYGTEHVASAEWVYDGSISGMDSSVISINGSAISPVVGTNRLTGKYHEFNNFTDGGDVKTVSAPNIANMADGVINDVDSYSGASTVDMIVNLKEQTVPKYFVLINRAGLNLQTYSYKIYASDSYTGVKSEEALVSTYSRTDDASVDHQVNIFQFAENQKAVSYFRIVFTKANYSFDNGIRYSELMLLGDKTGDIDPYAVEESSEQVIPSEKALTSTSTDYTIAVNTPWPWGVNGADKLQNGAVDGGAAGEFSIGYQFADYNASAGAAEWHTDGSRYLDITYTFDCEMNISNILLMGHSNQYWRIGHYKLYAGNDKATLYSDANEIAEYTNTGMAQRQLFTFGGEKAAAGQYVGLRILDPLASHTSGNTTVTETSNNSSTRLYEFKVYGEPTVTKYPVSFLDATGKTVYTATVAEGETIPEAELTAAANAVPEIYGYVKSLDENNKQVWSNDVTEPINAAASFTAVYLRNSQTYDVSYKKVNGEIVNCGKMKFDQKINLADDSAKVWLLNGEIIAEGAAATAYVCGDMSIEASSEDKGTAASVAIINAVSEVGKYHIMSHIYNPEGLTIQTCGVIFTSATAYAQMEGKEWSDENFGTLKHNKTAITGMTSTNFMSTLKNITTVVHVRRYAKAYVTFTNGTTVYSDAVFADYN